MNAPLHARRSTPHNPCLKQVTTLLPSVSSVAAFESTDIDTFRQSLSKVLRMAVEDNMDCQNLVADHVNWVQLAQHHDSPRRDSSYSSPLQEFMSIAVQPTVMPMAYSGTLCVALLRVLIRVGLSSTWTKSEMLLLTAIQTLRRRVPTFALERDIQHLLQTTGVERLDRVVSILRHLARDDLWFGTMVIKCLLTLLQGIDTSDIQALIDKGVDSTNNDVCWDCHRPMTGNGVVYETTRRRRQRHATLEQMHECEEGVTTTPVAATPSDHCTCLWVTRQVQVKARQWTQLPFRLVVLRSRIYQKILSIFANLRFHSTTKRDSLVVPGATIHILRNALDMSCMNAAAPSSRLAILLMIDMVGKKGYDYTLNFLWERFLNSNCLIALRTLTEILIESSHYNNQVNLWKALIPMAKYIQTKAQSRKSPSEDSKILLGAFASILSARNISACKLHLAECPIDAYDEFLRFMEMLKRHYDIASFWKSTHICLSEHQRNVNYLQDMGILPVIECRSTVEKTKQHWPFSELWSIRAAHRRMGPHVVAPNLFSCFLDDASLSMDNESTIPINEHLNDDVLLVVFSYLSYKPLASASKTCRTWNALLNGETVWENAYRARYTLLGTDAQIASAVTVAGSWKTLFRLKFQAQRELRFQRSSTTGFKYRTCNFCGCLKVLRSHEALEKHVLMHNSVPTKTRASSLAKVKMKRKASPAQQRPPKKRSSKSNDAHYSLPTDAMAAIELYLAQK